MKRIALADLQHHFKSAVMGDSIVPVAFELVRATDSFSKLERVGVYRHAYRARLLEALEEDFPLLKNQLGEEAFSEIAKSFIDARPSAYASLAEFSRHLPDFLSESSDRPEWLTDLARFEWHLVVAGTLERTLDNQWAEFSKLPDHKKLEVSLGLHPTASLFESRWAVDELRDLSPKIPSKTEVQLLIYRDGSEATVQRLSKDEAEAIRLLQRGTKLATMAEALMERGVSQENTVLWFTQWSQKRIVSFNSHNKQESL